MNWDNTPSRARRLYRTCVRSARKRGIDCTLTRDEFGALWHSANGCCTITGRSLDLDGSERGTFHRNPWAPSIDRIDSRVGYHARNCRIVCVAVNIAINEWGASILHEIANCLFPGDPTPELCRSGSGCVRGISKRIYKGEVRYDVRIRTSEGMKDFGRHRTYEAALAALSAARSSMNSAVEAR